MKILLLEDDLILNEILEEHLIKQKHQITTTFSSNEAIKELYSETFDLLLLDVNVPDLNGFELLKELRDNNILTPTIFITSLNMVEDMQKGFDSVPSMMSTSMPDISIVLGNCFYQKTDKNDADTWA
jgi:DNA-binding response OmpR family regulator